MNENRGKRPSPKKGATEEKQARRNGSTTFTDAEKIDLVNKILDDYRTGQFTIDSCCKTHGISYRSFQNWCEINSEFASLFKEAKKKSFNAGRDWLKEKVLNAMQQLITGFWIEEPEEETTTIKNKKGEVVQTITRVKKKKKYFAPTTAAVIYSLKNLDPENWNKAEPTIGADEPPQAWKIGDQIITF